ncbi:zinc finger, BED-type [Artemisia annua]|uniref:Zinc finger, BED-type n=1 Tax=Artemisia annua TaxID=35608 RepID=A0A2U1Q6X5_ARTAN|nr:zinc finger, BED-type [Artemisia annua]
MESSTVQSNSQLLKRNSNDVGWEFGVLVDPNKMDRVQCKLCNKVLSGGISRLKQHVAGIIGNTTPCPKSTNEQKTICRNAINEVKRKKKSKEDDDRALREEVDIGSSEAINLDEIEDTFGSLKSPSSFGPMDRFTSFVDKGKSKEGDVCNVIRKEQLVKVQNDANASDAVTQVVETLFPKDYVMQNKILMVELPIYKSKLEKFDRLGATKACEVNDESYDPAKGSDEELGPRTSSRLRERELYEDNFESESEDDVDEEVEYESDGVEIIEQYGQEEDQASI